MQPDDCSWRDSADPRGAGMEQSADWERRLRRDGRGKKQPDADRGAGRTAFDENLRREIGTKARMRVQEYYAIDNYVNQLVSYYEKLRKEG